MRHSARFRAVACLFAAFVGESHAAAFRQAGHGTTQSASHTPRPPDGQFLTVTMVTRRFSGASICALFSNSLEPLPTAVRRSGRMPCLDTR